MCPGHLLPVAWDGVLARLVGTVLVALLAGLLWVENTALDSIGFSVRLEPLALVAWTPGLVKAEQSIVHVLYAYANWPE